MIIFDPLTMPQPVILAFTSCEGPQMGKVVEWINKLWRVKLNTGMCRFVMPEQVDWMI